MEVEFGEDEYIPGRFVRHYFCVETTPVQNASRFSRVERRGKVDCSNRKYLPLTISFPVGLERPATLR